jgi:hypothetical protein
MKHEWSLSFTSRSWGLGVEVSFPSRSERFYLGTKLRTFFGFTVYLGPLTVEWRKEPEVIEYDTDGVKAIFEEVING